MTSPQPSKTSPRLQDLKNRIVTVLVAAIVCFVALQFVNVNVDVSNASAAVSDASAAQVETPAAPAPLQADETPVVDPAPAKPVAANDPIDAAMAKAPGVSPEVLQMALSAVRCAVTSGDISAPPTLTLI